MRVKCKNSGEDERTAIVSVRNSFDEALLDTLWEGVWAVNKADLTEEFVRDCIKSTVETFKNKNLPNIKDLFKRELKMDENMNDVQAQVRTDF
ncbi:hypothetical protein PINS_up013098 [Pythium insidiosum]|nr:hypothetical protein PINS_up013098 [Pythium insidiosum]